MTYPVPIDIYHPTVLTNNWCSVQRRVILCRFDQNLLAAGTILAFLLRLLLLETLFAKKVEARDALDRPLYQKQAVVAPEPFIEARSDAFVVLGHLFQR